MTLDGMEGLKAAVTSAPDVLKRHMSAAVRETAFAVADGARRRVPVRTGTLLSSIEADVSARNGLTGRVGISSRDAYYWRMVEFGTVHMAARPFFRPAAEEQSEKYIQRVRAVGKQLETDLGKQARGVRGSGLGSGTGGLL